MKSFFPWYQKAELLVPPLPWDKPVWRDRGGDTVVLLHGLWRGIRAMEPLARYLAGQGFSTLNLPYPSFRLPIESLAKHVCGEVAKVASERPVHFLTHSLGGILARKILNDQPAWSRGRLLMLAPPSTGSEIVDLLGNYPLLSRWLGPAGRSLASGEIPIVLPPLPEDLEVAVVMGCRSTIPFFRKWLEEENDGIVSVSRGHVPGLKGFSVVDADHTFISLHPEVWSRSAHFFATGEWPSSSEAG